MIRAACLLSATLALVACRGGDGSGEPLRFPEADDPDAFGLFLNPAPGVPAPGMPRASVDNVADFPVAYYNTIDPEGTRRSFDDWRRANGFLTADGQEAPCEAPTCERAEARFRDTKDLGYGREMSMRRDLVTGDVAVYVRNYQVDAITGLPYGPLNAEALAAEDRSWNFGINAIEFSAYPDTDGSGRRFAKFYNFAGDGKRALDASGTLQHAVDLDSRGLKGMPTPCIVCHGGEGRTLVVTGPDGRPMLAPTLPGRPPGDVMANLQMLELDTFQFVDLPGYRRADNEAAIAAINDAVLATWRARRDDRDARPNPAFTRDWDPELAIGLLENRYPERTGSGPDTRLSGRFDGSYVPDGWTNGGGVVDDELGAEIPALYRDIVGPNCMVCHMMRGSSLNDSLNFGDLGRFLAYRERTDHLVFARGVMPLGLLNYANLWDDPTKDTARLARVLGHPERVVDGRVPSPGAPRARIAAPTVVTGIDAEGRVRDIPLSGRDSAFADPDSFVWRVEPADGAEIVDAGVPGLATLRASTPGSYTISLEVEGTERDARSSETLTLTVLDADAEGATPPPPDAVTFYGPDGVFALLSGTCATCHVAGGLYDGIPLHYERCRGEEGEDDFLYRSVLSRVNFAKPLDSLILRKPSNGATDLADLAGSQIANAAGDQYHGGGYAIGSEAAYGTLVSWVLNGAPRGAPATPPDASAPACAR